MKKHILLLTLFVSSFIFSQTTRIGDFGIAEYGHSKLSKSDLEDFKNSTTYFVIDEGLGLFQVQFESILNDVWNITPFRVITDKNFNKNLSENNSYARFHSFSVTKESSLTTSTSSYTVFDFFMPKKLKKTRKGEYKWRSKRVASIYFTIDVAARKDVVKEKTKIGGDIINYRLGYIKNAFQKVNDGLLNKESNDIYEDFVNKNELKKLKNQKLYFEEDLIYGYNAFSIKEKDAFTKEELFEDYQFDYEVITSDELNENILSATEDFYYLMYNQINSNKILTIVNGKTGETVFQEHKKMSFNLKPKDLKQLSKSIEKAK